MSIASQWPVRSLGEVVEETQYGTSTKANEDGVGVPVLRMNNITYNGAIDLTDVKHVDLPAKDLDRYSVRPGDLLFNRTNSQELVGKMGVWDRAEPYAFAGYLVRLRLRRDVADPAFVAAWFNTSEMKAFLRTRAKPSINMSNINATEALKLPLVCPPLAVQRRIAEVLDRAEALRAKRRAALAQLDTLTQAIFLDLFGDPVSNLKGWPTVRLGEVLSRPLRNGRSPSSAGGVVGKVLTLSAVTGNAFDPDAWKEGAFHTSPSPDDAVDIDDFLICRGNGNIRLVGKGYFPTVRLPNVIFPDTMIAARITADRFEREFLQSLWHSREVRRQIESLARTTNGTFKVNQTILEGVVLLAPPLHLQRVFTGRSQGIGDMKAAHRASLTQMDALFASLQHRAFQGQL